MPKNKDLIQQSEAKSEYEKSDKKAFECACTALEEIKKHLRHCTDLDDLHTIQVLDKRVDSNSEAINRNIPKHLLPPGNLSEVESRVSALIKAKSSELSLLNLKDEITSDMDVFDRAYEALHEVKLHLENCNDVEDLHTIRVMNNRIDLKCEAIIRQMNDQSAQDKLIKLGSTVAGLMEAKTLEFSSRPQVPGTGQVGTHGFFSVKAKTNTASKVEHSQKTIIDPEQGIKREINLG